MLRIRLSRIGKKRQPSYRIVVADVEAKRDGRIVERIGHYNPLTDPIDFRVEEARALHWLSVGAQPTDAVQRLLVKQGTIDRLERLRKGESLETLVAEFEGTEPETVRPAAPAPAAEPESVVEVDEAVAEAADATEDVATDVVEDVTDTVAPEASAEEEE